mgnify:CR=1 FL=1
MTVTELHARVNPLPYYAEQAGECEVFSQAWSAQLPLLIKGPTGCGKTRFVEHMAARLGRPLITVSCHDDLSAADLVPAIGRKNRVYEVLNGTRALTLPMIWRLHEMFGIPAQSLIKPRQVQGVDTTR